MHCVDCHFKRDNHGNGSLYGEPRNAVEITCVDCHGTSVSQRADLAHQRPAAPEGGTDLTELVTPFEGLPRFELGRGPRRGQVTQRSMVEPDCNGRFRRSWTRSRPAIPLQRARTTGQDDAARRPDVGRPDRG